MEVTDGLGQDYAIVELVGRGLFGGANFGLGVFGRLLVAVDLLVVRAVPQDAVDLVRHRRGGHLVLEAPSGLAAAPRALHSTEESSREEAKAEGVPVSGRGKDINEDWENTVDGWLAL